VKRAGLAVTVTSGQLRFQEGIVELLERKIKTIAYSREVVGVTTTFVVVFHEHPEAVTK
jgi:hypothetical protein